jgi:hypothetical protein
MKEAAEREIVDSEDVDMTPAENESTAETAEETAQAEAEFAAHVALYVFFVHSCKDPRNRADADLACSVFAAYGVNTDP